MVPEKGLNRALTAILSGPSASGKTAIALEFARAARAQGLPLELINADSLLLYRTMDIGTAKPSRQDLIEIPHHLIDIRDPNEPFTAGDFARLVIETLAQLENRGMRALIVGGSGFYLKALLYGLWEGAPCDPAVRRELEAIPSPELYESLHRADPQSALRIGVNDRYRLVRAHELLRITGKSPSQLQAEHNREADPGLRLLLIDRPAEELHERVARRTRAMLDSGWVDEVREIRSRFPGARALGAVGYRQIVQYLEGIQPSGRKAPGDIGDLASEIDLATRQLIKRQRTWFKGERSAERFELDRERPALLARLKEIYFPEGPR